MKACANPPAELKGKLDGFFNKPIELTEAQMSQFFIEIKLQKEVIKDASSQVMEALFKHITEISTVYLQSHPNATMEEFVPLANDFTEMMRIVEFGICEEKKDLGE
ncbi:TetR/AcrR family transcriptional regulator, partial [Salmonella enterica subsp. enterica serovar Newport]